METPNKITDYFPPSPKSNLEDEAVQSVTKGSDKAEPTNTNDCKKPLGSLLDSSSVLLTPKASPNKEEATGTKTETSSTRSEIKSGTSSETKTETSSTESKTGTSSETKPGASSETKIETSSTEPKTGTSSETKSGTSSESNLETKTEELVKKPTCQKSLSDELKKEPAESKKSRKKGRRKKGAGTPTPNTPTSTPPAPKAKSVRRKVKETDTKNTLVTDYFPVRRSDRRCKSDIQKEKEEDLEYKVLNGIEDGLKVEDIENKGRGVVATKAFSRGDFVVEYAGDLIDLKKAKEREDKYKKDEEVGCYMYYFNFKNKSYCIDATAESGKLGRLLNHSKTSGNCHTKLVEVKGNPYLILVASKDISVGEELQYDYGDRSKTSIDSHPWLKS